MPSARSRAVATTEGSATFTPEASPSAMMPPNMVTAIRPIMSSVVAALRLLGLRKAGTPLLMASTPVSAAQPVEKARRIRKAAAKAVRSLCSATIEKSALGACNCSPKTTVRKPPTTIIPSTTNMNA